MADNACATCKKTAAQAPNLKRCAKCSVTYYCSRDCQKADWKVHKKICSKQAGSSTPGLPSVEHSETYQTPRSSSLEKHISDPFTRIDKGTFLHDRPEKDVYKLLVDALRMSEQDWFKLGGVRVPGSVYDGKKSSIATFRTFLDGVERHRGYMPSWWNAEKRKECEEFAENGGDFSSLKKKVTKDEMIRHYGNDRAPMQLRMFVEEALGQPPPGVQPGAGKFMRQQMMTMERPDGRKDDGDVVGMANINNLTGGRAMNPEDLENLSRVMNGGT